MRRFLIFCFLLVCHFFGYTQYLTQSADGKGSFLFKGSSIAFDVSKTELSLNLNNLNRAVTTNSKYLNHRAIFGGAVSVKNDDGIGSLISSGDFTAEGTLSLYAGYQWSNSYLGYYQDKVKDYSDKLQKMNEEQVGDFIKMMKPIIVAEIKKTKNIRPAEAKEIKDDWFAKLEEKAPHTVLNYIETYSTNNTDVKALMKRVFDKGDKIVTQFKDAQKSIKAQLTAIEAEDDLQDFWKVSIFALQTFEASDFKRIDTVNRQNLPKSFIPESFRGSKTGIGANLQLNRWRLGITYAYKITNNFSDLKKQEYKITSTTVSGSQTLIQETPYTAYAGSYAEIELMELNIDLIYTLGLGKESETYALLNPYYRGNLYSRNQAILPSNYSFGMGFYFFSTQSKFLGGFYVELPDADNSIARNVPPDEQNIRPALQKLTFGLVGKFSLSSILGQQ